MIDRRSLPLALGWPLAVGAREGASGVLELDDPAGLPEVKLRVFLHRPASWMPDGRVAFVLHGQGRNAEEYMSQWVAHADAARLLLVAPEFSHRKFPTTASYNYGNVVDESGRANPPQSWNFAVIDRVWQAVRAHVGARRNGYALFGHSAGAQFVHRYLLLAEAEQAENIITANAGSYTMPIPGVAFPFGLAGTAVTDAMLVRAFARPVTVLLGSDDVDPRHPSLPRQPGAIEQGPHRLARGMRFFGEAQAVAARLGVPFRWRLETVPGVGHSNAGMAARASAIMGG